MFILCKIGFIQECSAVDYEKHRNIEEYGFKTKMVGLTVGGRG